MNFKKQFIFTLLIASIGLAQAAPRRSNPIVSHMFTADASAHVWDDGRLYVYPSSDTSPPSGYGSMDGYHVFSTDDMISWIDHGEILHSRDVKWGTKRGGYMWAPDCAFKDGTYYFFFPHKNAERAWEIGVATSQKPASDFKLQGYIEGGNTFCDPCVFIDDDGQAYLYAVVNAKCYAAKLTDNMMAIEGEMVRQIGVDEHREGPFVFKRNGIYYMIYPDHHRPFNEMQYSMSDSPLGPWEPKGLFVEQTDVITMHGSVVEYKGQWYLFYHSGALSGGIEHNRSICFDPVYFNEDGSIQMVKQSRGVELPTFHQEVNFNGLLGTLDVGEYTTADLAKLGIPNDVISSLEVAPGYVVECFEEDKGKGKSWRFENNVLNLGDLGCDDTFSSIKIRKATTGNLVDNGSFEQGVQQTISYWQGRRVIDVNRVLENPSEGYYALRYQGNQAMNELSQKIILKPDTDYSISASLKVDAGTEGQVFIEAAEPFDQECTFKLDAGKKAGQWVPMVGTFNSGNNESITIRIGTSEDFKGACYWDDIILIEQM
jgi:hypothetical protein